MDRPLPSRALALVSLVFILNGCSTTGLPEREIAEARSAVRLAAQAVGPQSSAQLQNAQRKFALAQRWIAAKDFRPALWLVEQARVDAELALAEAAAFGATGIGAAE